MDLNIGTLIRILAVIIASSTIISCNKEAPVSYAKNVQPIFDKNCIDCHISGGIGTTKSGYSLTNYENVMKGTKFGPVIKPGESISSTLVLLIENKADPSLKMPHGNRPSLSQVEIQTIKNWIDQGAKKN